MTPAWVAQQRADGQPGQVGVGQLRQPLAHRVVQPQLAPLHQDQAGGGRKGLGVRGDPEQVVGGERHAPLVVG